MRIAAEQDWNFMGGEIVRVGQEIARTFSAVADPLAHSQRELRAKVFIEVEEVGPGA